MNAETIIYLGGVFHVGWALFDFFWPNIFRWKVTLAHDDLNRILLHITSKLLVVLYSGIAYVSFRHTQDLITTEIGKSILLFVAIYWTVRAIMQVHFFGFEKANELNMKLSDYLPIGNASNKVASFGLFIVFLIGVALYAIPLI